MAIAYVQGFVATSKVTTNTNYVQSFSLTTSAAVTSGNTLLLGIGVSAGSANSVGSVTDSQGNTWTKLGSSTTGAGYASADVWMTNATATGVITVTVNSAGGGYYGYALNLREYSGANGGLDVINITSDGSGYNQAHTATVTTTQANDMIVVFTSQNTNTTETFTATVPLANLIQMGDGLYTTMASADATQGAVTTGNYVISTAGYDNGVTFAVALAPTAVVIPTPPGPTNTPGWYPYGSLPTGKTVAQLKTITQNWWTNHFKPYIITTGMPSGMTAGAMRVYRPENSNDTVSEGMGYGLIAAVLMAEYDPSAQAIFDGLFKYVKYYYNANGMMSWHIDSSGGIIDTGSATDADVDIAWGLYLANQKWGTSGTTFNYATERDNYLAAMLSKDFYSATHTNTALRNVQINGDGWDSGQTGSPDKYDPDYTSPMYYTAWTTFNSRWNDIKSANWNVVKLVDRFNTGLLPDRMTRSATAASGENFNSGYNAVRRFRQVSDFLNYGSTQPSPYPSYYLEKHLADFIATKSANTPANMKAEWSLDGSTSGTYINSLFASSYMVAMLVDPTNSQLASDTIDWIVAHPDGSYFGDTVAFMNLATAAGYMTPSTTAYAGKSLNTDYINFAFSSAATTYTRSHGTSSVKRKASAISHTTSAVVRKATTRTHTTDANKRVSFTRTHTTDAQKRVANLTRSHSTSSVLRRAFTRQHSTDSLKLARTIRSHSTDAVKRISGITRSHTTDAYKRIQVTRSHSTDTLKRKQSLASHSTSSVLRRAITRAHSTDTVKRVSGLLRTHSTDTFKRLQFSRSHTTSAQLFVRNYSSLVDNFDDGVADSSKWQGAYIESGGVANFSGDSTTTTYIKTAQTRSLISDALFFKYFAFTGTFISQNFEIQNSSGTMIYRVSHDENGTMSVQNSAYSTLGSWAYVTGYDWIRIRESGGTFYVDTAITPSSGWVNRYSGTAAAGLNASYFQAYAGWTGGSGGGKGGAGASGWIDNFNVSAAQFTRTHSTDSFKRRATAISHSTDAVKRTTTSKTHSTDALKRVANITRPHSTSANLRKAFTRTHTTDALKRGNYVRFHSTDAVKRVAGLTRTHSTDAIKRTQNVKTHSTDTLKRAQLTRSHSTSAVVRKAFTRSHSTDANKRLAITRQHSTDANKRISGFTRVHSTDTLKRQALVRTHTTDTVKRVSGLTRSHSTNALLRKQFVRTHTTDSLLKIRVPRLIIDDDFTAAGTAGWDQWPSDGGLEMRVTDQYNSAPASLSFTGSLTQTGIMKAVTLVPGRKYYARMWIKANTAGSMVAFQIGNSGGTTVLGSFFTMSGAWQQITTVFTATQVANNFGLYDPVAAHAYNVDDILLYEAFEHSTDANKTNRGIKSHSTDSNKRKQLSVAHSTDSNKKRANVTRTHTTDALKRVANITRTHSTDTVKRKQFVLTHSTDALKRQQFSRSHSTDSFKRTQNVRTHSTDAIKRAQYLRSHTTSSIIRGANAQFHNTDANKKRAYTRSHTTDANKRLSGITRTHSTDTIKRKQFVVSHTTNAVLRKAYTRAHSTDTNKRKAFTRSHTTDANKRTSGLTKLHTTNALLRKFNFKSHTTSSVLRATSIVSHSTDGSIHTLGQTAHTTDSIHRDYRYYTREQNPVLPTDANSRSIGFYKAEVYNTGLNDNANYVDQSGVKYLLFYFEQYTGNNRDQFYVTWNGKSTIATSTRPVYLQVFNQSTQLWETLDMNNNTAPNTEFTLTGQKTVGMQNYYDANVKLTARVYQ